ncbi:MAG TPA: hypothetical protein VLY24_20435, partial [Bryobacteraceae bacterium]|nr:hypothetical protein [Bryobacteraceae bacterium]
MPTRFASLAVSKPKPAERITQAIRALWLRVEGLPTRQASILIFGIGMAIRMVAVILLHMYVKPDRYEMERAALSVAWHGTLADPYMIPTGPTAH